MSRIHFFLVVVDSDTSGCLDVVFDSPVLFVDAPYDLASSTPAFLATFFLSPTGSAGAFTSSSFPLLFALSVFFLASPSSSLFGGTFFLGFFSFLGGGDCSFFNSSSSSNFLFSSFFVILSSRIFLFSVFLNNNKLQNIHLHLLLIAQNLES